MSDLVSYKISFPDIEVNAIHAKAAIEQAIEELKRKDDTHGISTDFYAITWNETHTDECHCNNCEDERQ